VVILSPLIAFCGVSTTIAHTRSLTYLSKRRIHCQLQIQITEGESWRMRLLAPAPDAILRPAPEETTTPHYFDPGPRTDGELKSSTIQWGHHRLEWMVAPGIFSPRDLDDGSRLLLDALVVPTGGLLLDLGCGSGPLGLLPHLRDATLRSVLTDINPVALRCAAANARLHAPGRALVVHSWAASAIAPDRFDVVVTNPPIRAGRKVVEEILRGGLCSIKNGGSFYMVVRVQQGGWTLAARLGEWLGREPELVGRRKGYLVFRASKVGPV
jgi:16S rRNA (guanine1207-N2)-methyltransferase